MKIAIVGATGTTGKHFVRFAVQAGHHVVAYVRSPDAFTTHERLSVLQGELDDVPGMRAAFESADVVVSCLGIRAGAFAMRGPLDFQQRTLPRVLDAIEQAGVPRFVLMTSFGAGDTAWKASRFARWFIYHGIARGIFEDKARSELALSHRRVNWTAVYPVMLHEAPATGEVALVPLQEVERVPGLPRLPFADVAAVLLALCAVQDRAGQRLLLTKPRSWR
jgi:NAD(P)-dependent dehydrogenase (short-subunit alcohol dehydrogenase family)